MPDHEPAPRLGVALTLVGTASTAWLSATGRLDHYVHPRYVVFTTVMAVVAAVLALGALVLPAAAAARRRTRVAGGLLLACTVVVLVVLPPATLSVDAAQQRQVNLTISSSAPELAGGADYAHFRLRDWAAAIQLASGPKALQGRPFTGTGFVTPVGDDHPDEFYLTRFVVTCCAVDAQPVGVPVHRHGWRDELPEGAWVRVRGTLGAAPDDPEAPVVLPSRVERIAEPAEPYEH